MCNLHTIQKSLYSNIRDGGLVHLDNVWIVELVGINRIIDFDCGTRRAP